MDITNLFSDLVIALKSKEIQRMMKEAKSTPNGRC
jgi:hypothetical protein